jgi:hypothetical protein
VFRAAVPRLYIESDEPETTENRKEIDREVRPGTIPSKVDGKNDKDRERFASLKDECRDDAAIEVCVPCYSILYVSEGQIKNINMQYNARSFDTKIPRKEVII